MSFILQNVGLQLSSLGKLEPLKNISPIFGWFGVYGDNNAAPKSFPNVLSDDNLLDLVIFPPRAALTRLRPKRMRGKSHRPQAQGTEEPTATLDPTQAAEETSIIGTIEAENGTPISAATDTPLPDAAASETPQPDQAEALATLDPTQAAEETSIIGTLEAEHGTPVVAATDAPGAAAPSDNSGSDGTQAAPDAPAADSPAADPPTNKIRITIKDVLVISVAMILMLALNWFVEKTRLGKAMRATAQNRAAAQIMGINIDNIISLTFIIGGALAGAAGMMSGLYNGTVVFTMGFTAGLRSFTAAVFGGIGNIRGAALGGVLIGIIAALSDQFLSVRWTNAWVFLILVLVLILRPTGLLGSESGEKA